MGRVIVVITLYLALFLSPVFAAQSLFYKEINIIGGYSNRDKWIGKSDALKNSVGFEDYRKFSNEYGDFLTTDLQVRVAYDDQEKTKDAFGVEIHNAWLAYKYSLGHDLKVGHFAPEFGLEPIVDTHGTILQTLMMDNIGFKKDWGVGLEGVFSNFDYGVALQLGSGMAVRMKGDNYLATARIGVTPNKSFQHGLSFLWGNALESGGMKTFPRDDLPGDKAVLKRRVGLDLQYLFGPYQFKGEVAYGKDPTDYVLGYLTEIDYTLPSQQNCNLALQFKSWIDDLDGNSSEDSSLTFCVSCRVHQKMTLRVSTSRDFNLADGSKDSKVFAQLYYYGN